MAEKNVNTAARQLSIRHRGRGAQVWIYLGKMIRMFVYQSDWKVLPMSAVIAGLVGLVIRNKIFVTMEGTLLGSFALVMVCIWNGCFNSIQAICRERDVIKREHRSGMHISSYIAAHMFYQAMLCSLQAGITLYVTNLVGVEYPAQGLLTRWLVLEFGFSMFIISFASDMLSLWVSALSRNTTTAMTIMPFVLIFQLVFSGGMFDLPEWTHAITPFTVSNAGLNLLCTQADYNDLPIKTIWEQVEKMQDKEFTAEISVGKVLTLLQNEDIETVAEIRRMPVDEALYGEASLDPAESAALAAAGAAPGKTVGQVIDELCMDPEVRAYWDDEYPVTASVGSIVNAIGSEKVMDILTQQVAKANRKPEYNHTKENVWGYWSRIILHALIYAALAMITLEFIDKDKR